MSNPKLKKDLIITCIEDCIIPGTGLSFFYYRYNKYKIIKYLDKWYELKGLHAWQIQLISGKGDTKIGWFSEDDLFKNFNANIYLRKEKLEKINKLSDIS